MKPIYEPTVHTNVITVLHRKDSLRAEMMKGGAE